jgi:hypothetical protein
MTAETTSLAGQRTQVLDRLFSCLADAAAGHTPAGGVGEECLDPAAADAAEFANTQPPPLIENADDLRAAHEWLLRERQRLDVYTRDQLARVQQERQSFVQQTNLKEQALVLRMQEHNRREEMLVHQSGALRQRAEALAEQERKVAVHLDAMRNGQAELEELRRVSAALRQDVQGQRVLLQRLHTDAASVEREREAARADLAAREASLRGEKEAFAARQERLNQRLQALDEADAAAGRRAAELEEMETRLRRDFQRQEEEQAQLRQVSTGLAADTKGQRALLERLLAEAASLVKARDTSQKHLASQAAAVHAEKAKLAARQEEMNRRLRALDEAEAAIQRRATELDELESRQREELAEQERQLHVLRQEARAADPCTVHD